MGRAAITFQVFKKIIPALSTMPGIPEVKHADHGPRQPGCPIVTAALLTIIGKCLSGVFSFMRGW